MEFLLLEVFHEHHHSEGLAPSVNSKNLCFIESYRDFMLNLYHYDNDIYPIIFLDLEMIFKYDSE
jgi:hypothetical protein